VGGADDVSDDHAVRQRGALGSVVGSQGARRPVNEEQQLPTYEEAIHRAGIRAGQRVLEVGCGSGVFLRAAADRGAEVTGVDASEALIELARERVPEADLRVADMQFLPFEDDSFDVVAGGVISTASST